MPDTRTYQFTSPGLLPLYTRALRPGRSAPSSDIQLPRLSASLVGARSAGYNLTRYARVCGFAPSLNLPITWPHVMAFPLQMKVLTEKEFPLPLLGLVHLRNSITQHRAIGTGEPLDLRVCLGEQSRTSRGIEFELLTEAIACGDKVWEECSTLLFRIANQDSRKASSTRHPPEMPDYPHQQTINAPADTGRQYARVSSDSNPIHLYAMTAKAFGFPRAIAHGMWSKARVLATLQSQEGWKEGPVRVNCHFKKPLFLPGQAQLQWQAGPSEWPFQLVNEKGDAPHLSGSIEWLQA
ncbi:hypothetical protein LPB19_09085 [Marinobacter salinisoli]|uniref:MaoC-like domain-containing protein n=1 Tax=Marinobacter salinisoli TaxID=2769486 RepID=A0ABX7MML4_9GAMM|nr:MaoC/PaaZ C-terminal domain-containing protein [Marinobacter salinisoli]QSP93388.1 hypothetical protein LPB19_09085 [Marinobacter salinisoli]